MGPANHTFHDSSSDLEIGPNTSLRKMMNWPVDLNALGIFSNRLGRFLGNLCDWNSTLMGFAPFTQCCQAYS